MSASPHETSSKSVATQWIARGLASYAFAAGVLTLIGWFAGIRRLTDWGASGISMFPNTAVESVCVATAVWLHSGKSSRWSLGLTTLLGFTVVVLGTATLFEHLSGTDLGIDTLVAKATWGNAAAVAPGRMGPPASVAFTLTGIALILLPSRWRLRSAIPVLGILVCATSILSIAGYAFGADPLFAVARYTGIAVQTATILLAMGLAILASVPEYEPARTLLRDNAAGLLARRSLPFVVFLPILLASVRVWAQRAGWIDTGMGIGLAKIARDITERKATEEKLREAQRKLLIHAADLEATVAERTAKLQETVNELQSFSYSIAHDMRAPLRAMGTFAQLLLGEASAGGLPADAKDFCERIIGAGRLDSLINDALNYTKSSLQEFPLQAVDLSKLVRGLLDTYPNLHPGKADIQIGGQLPVVLGNESLLTQCFSNLLGNAVKFVAPGVRAHVRVRAERNDGLVRVWVEDNGIGIPKHAQPRLFAMFQKLDNQYEGSGIGLAIVRKVAERMGGKVGVESEPGQGSRFWVDLRLAKKEST